MKHKILVLNEYLLWFITDFKMQQLKILTDVINAKVKSFIMYSQVNNAGDHCETLNTRKMRCKYSYRIE